MPGEHMIGPVEVIIDQVADHCYQERSLDAIEGIMLHRVGVDLETGVIIGTDAHDICDAFTGRDERWASVARITGHQNPYTFIVGGRHGHQDLDGKVWQALPLDEIGHHGRRFSTSHIGIGLIGDFRAEAPTARQWQAALDLCVDLCLMLTLPPEAVVGHGELPRAHGGEKAPGEPGACPGDRLVMSVFREEVRAEMARRMAQDARWRLEGLRVMLP